MKLIDTRDLPFVIKNFLDENYDLVTPKKSERFQIGLFDHFLNEVEVVEFYDSNSVQKNFSENEMRYFNFITEVFKNSSTQIFMEIEIGDISNSKNIEILNILDFEDKHIWIEFVKKLYTTNSNLIRIDSQKEMKMFFKIITRELASPIFHFENGKVNLLGNFDLFFPMFFENTELVNKYKVIALKNNLHILKIEN